MDPGGTAARSRCHGRLVLVWPAQRTAPCEARLSAAALQGLRGRADGLVVGVSLLPCDRGPSGQQDGNARTRRSRSGLPADARNLVARAGSPGAARSADALVSAMVDADIGTRKPGELFLGGCLHKVVRWSFERQGLFATASPEKNVEGPGLPPKVDLWVKDRRRTPIRAGTSRSTWNGPSQTEGAINARTGAGLVCGCVRRRMEG